MSIRKNILISKKLFLSSLALFLITCTGMLHTGLKELYHIKTKEGKTIILVGTEHTLNNTEEFFPMLDLIEAQEQREKLITLLMEEVLNDEHSLSALSLSSHCEKYPFDKTVVKNIEIRAVSTAVLNLLNPDKDLNDLSADSYFQNGSSAPKIMVDAITFQQIYDEYNHLTETLSANYQKYDDLNIQELFKQKVDNIENHYKQLQLLFTKWKNKYGIKEDEAILSLIKKIKQAEQLKPIKEIDENKKCLILSQKLMVHIFRIFIPLFDINAFDLILQQQMSSDIILLVAGYLHARTMKNWLASCDSTLVQSIVKNNVDLYVTNNDNVANNDMIDELVAILNIENPITTNV